MKALAVELSKRSRAGAASRITRRPGRCQNGGMRREADKLRCGHADAGQPIPQDRMSRSSLRPVQ
jgi:hypothetical protein